MLLPTQSQPVQRTLVSRPFVNGSANDPSGHGSEQGMWASEYGVQPSGNFDWGSRVSTTIPILASLF